jgi:FlaA1/EpsC-like NDP-sugar epimerase
MIEGKTVLVTGGTGSFEGSPVAPVFRGFNEPERT